MLWLLFRYMLLASQNINHIDLPGGVRLRRAAPIHLSLRLQQRLYQGSLHPSSALDQPTEFISLALRNGLRVSEW